MDESEQYMLYLKDYLDLWPHFCWHKDKSPKQIYDKVLFKQEFTFERWKEGYWEFVANKSLHYTQNDDLDGIALKKLYTRLTYNSYRFIPFNIKYELI